MQSDEGTTEAAARFVLGCGLVRTSYEAGAFRLDQPLPSEEKTTRKVEGLSPES